MDNDDEQKGIILTRREVLSLLGIAGAGLIVGCAPNTGQSGATPSLNAEAATSVAIEGDPTALVQQTEVVATAETANATLTVPDCIVRPVVTEGPYYVDAPPERADIRTDPTTGVEEAGALLALTFNVSQITGNSCGPFPNAVVDIWHCNAAGVYSGVSDPSFDTSDQKFLRGYQVTDANGQATFTTIYPGWYSGRAVHIHFKVRTDAAAASGYEFTSQLFFDDAFSDQVFTQAPYAAKGQRNQLNSTDGIFQELLVVNATQTADGYAATFDIGLDLSVTPEEVGGPGGSPDGPPPDGTRPSGLPLGDTPGATPPS